MLCYNTLIGNYSQKEMQEKFVVLSALILFA